MLVQLLLAVMEHSSCPKTKRKRFKERINMYIAWRRRSTGNKGNMLTHLVLVLTSDPLHFLLVGCRKGVL